MKSIKFTDADGDRALFRPRWNSGLGSSVTVLSDGYCPLEAYLTDDDLRVLRDAITEHLEGASA